MQPDAIDLSVTLDMLLNQILERTQPGTLINLLAHQAYETAHNLAALLPETAP